MLVHLNQSVSGLIKRGAYLVRASQGMVNGPLKMISLGKFYSSLGISHNLVMGLGISDFVSVGHIFAFLSSQYTLFVSGSDFKM